MNASYGCSVAEVAPRETGALDEDMDLEEWAEELAYSLGNGSGSPGLLTLASCVHAPGQASVIATARATVTAAGWPLYECTAAELSGRSFRLQESGYLILHGVDNPTPVEVPVLIGAFQHLVSRGLPVGLLVAGTPAGIRGLRAHPAMGFLSRAEAVEA
ncbi:hypothetical protein B0G38_004340 [Arthrobacter sp. VKM Ac-2550]|nr:hypothetical protein [Arthrobacter sp. VKM Ac-2550]